MNFQNTLWQSKKWAAFQEATDHETFWIDDVLVIIRQTVFGWRFFEIPRAEVAKRSESFWDRLEREAKKRGAIFTRVFPADKASVSFFKGGRKEGVPEIFPEYTLVVDLSLSKEEILTQMKSKGRYNISLAERKGVEVFESDNISLFTPILEETARRDKFSAHPEKVYAQLIKTFGKDAFFLLAKYKEKVIAGGIFLFCDDVCTYYYGASSNEHRNVMAPYLVQWRAMEEAKKRGCEWYDFLGIAPASVESGKGSSSFVPRSGTSEDKRERKHPLTGVSQFKRKFGGIEKKYASAFEVVHRRGRYFVLKLLKKLRSFFR